MSYPLVTVVTATRGWCDTLFRRCIPSVQAQTYPALEHLIVSEPDPQLRQAIGVWRARVPIRYIETGPGRGERDLRHDQPGAAAYGLGAAEAGGDIVAYCGDDDELLEHHVRTAVHALVETGADFTTSMVDFQVGGTHKAMIGDGTLRLCTLDTISIVHRRRCLEVANWRAASGVADWQLVTDWAAGGLRHHHLPRVTAIHHDGRYSEVAG